MINKLDFGNNRGGYDNKQRTMLPDRVEKEKGIAPKGVVDKGNIKGEKLLDGSRDIEVLKEEEDDYVKDKPAKVYSGETKDRLAGRGGADMEKALSLIGGRDKWETFLSQIRGLKLTLGIWLMSAIVKEVKDGIIVLGFDSNNRFAREMIGESKNRRYIENHLGKFYGKKFTIEVTEVEFGKVENENKNDKKTTTKKNITPDIDKLVENVPMAKRLIEEFDGEVYGIDDQRGRIDK